ncbi:MAG TPA: hypothetical protein DHW71_02430 [Gammaproteobacteria bacterium]|nr:hypothetical protein [Gammaproteobacteria bacterium]HBF08306.1 hypothetical protein [Gammaproteobacteria bacterium]HCK91812.1 hypothetical protein [Gammaproteobacteria bacterium]|tara:strand:+ start:619 stop:1704 length:1086 start_codon:yes stop_codon:yes gene_type:complete
MNQLYFGAPSCQQLKSFVNTSVQVLSSALQSIKPILNQFWPQTAAQKADMNAASEKRLLQEGLHPLSAELPAFDSIYPKGTPVDMRADLGLFSKDKGFDTGSLQHLKGTMDSSTDSLISLKERPENTAPTSLESAFNHINSIEKISNGYDLAKAAVVLDAVHKDPKVAGQLTGLLRPRGLEMLACEYIRNQNDDVFAHPELTTHANAALKYTAIDTFVKVLSEANRIHSSGNKMHSDVAASYVDEHIVKNINYLTDKTHPEVQFLALNRFQTIVQDRELRTAGTKNRSLPVAALLRDHMIAHPNDDAREAVKYKLKSMIRNGSEQDIFALQSALRSPKVIKNLNPDVQHIISLAKRSSIIN